MSLKEPKKSFHKTLCDLLKTDTRFIDRNGELVTRAVSDRAWNTDHGLVKLLLSHSEIKKKFFNEIEGHWVFNTKTFIDYISDKNLLDNSYTRFRNKIGLNIGNKFLQERGEVSLAWPYKDCVLEGGQTEEKEKRKEIFFNEILAQDEINKLFDQKVLTNWKRHTANGEEKVTKIKRNKNGIIRENLIIKGNNLLTLHTLKRQFQGKVKLIYIDPPYNTGNDAFKYNDNFNHSSWLTFMKNRLEIARKLLREDGVIFLSINHIELGYVSILMDEIFNKENKLPIVTLKVGTTASYRSINDCPVNVTEYVLIYSKSVNFKPNPIYRETGYTEDYSHFIRNYDKPSEDWQLVRLTDLIHKKNGCNNWREYKQKIGDNWKRKRFEAMEEFAIENKNRVVSLNTLQKPSKKIKKIIEQSKKTKDRVCSMEKDNAGFLHCFNGRTLAFFSSKFKNIEGKNVPCEILTNLWTDISFLGIGPEGGITLRNGKKPEHLLKNIIELVTEKNDIVLDFHLGSGTTAAVAHKMGRQYIGIEQLDYGTNDSVVRLKNVINGDASGISKSVQWKGGGNFIYCELMKYNEIYMDKIQEAKSSNELLSLWKDISKNSFLNWHVNPELPEEAIKDFILIGQSTNFEQKNFQKKELEKIKRIEKLFPSIKEVEEGLKKQKRLLSELLNKNQLYVNHSEIDDKNFNVIKEDKKLNTLFFNED